MKRNVVKILCAILGISLLCGCSEKRGSYEPAEEEAEEAEESETEEGDTEESKPEEEPEEPEEPEEEKEADLKEILLKESKASEESLQVLQEADYDGDGTKEAFALIGESVDGYGTDELYEGSIWYVKEDGAQKLADSVAMGISSTVREMKMGETEYVMFDEYFISERMTYVWYVEDGEAVEAEFSRVGEVLDDLGEKNRFRIVEGSYDAVQDTEFVDWNGHTWKSYYFFYDSEEDKVREYAGTHIDAETAEQWCGRDIVDELIPDVNMIDDIFCRGNCLITINYHSEEDGLTYYYHYHFDFEKGCLVDDNRAAYNGEALPGIYRQTICPRIASYPEVPGPGDMVWYE